MPLRLAFTLSVVLLLPAAVHAEDRRPIRETDLLDFVWIADPQISPDGSAVAFVRVVVNRVEDTYDSSIWVVPTEGGEPRAMTPAGGQRRGARWNRKGSGFPVKETIEP